MLKHLLLALLIIGANACSKKLGPDESLREFVVKSLSSQMTKEEILESTTGNLHSDLEALSDEDMEKYLKMDGASKESFRINLSNCEKDVCYLTYTLKYDTSKDGAKTFGVELKKMAEMRKIDEVWLVADVTDIKTYYEAEQPIEP